MHGLSSLLPSSLPPLSTVTTKLDDETLTTLLDSKRKKRQLPSLESSSVTQHSLASNSVLSMSTSERRSTMSKSAPSFNASETNTVATRKFSQQHGSLSRKESRILTLIEETGADEESPKRPSKGSVDTSPLIDRAASFRSLDGSDDGNISDTDLSLATTPFNHEVEVVPQHLVHLDDMVLLASRPFPLPTESKNCLVQIYCSREYDENLRIVVVPPGATQEKLAERLITIDHAYDLVHASGHSSQLMHSTEQDDLQSLSDFLINMFKEADVDGSGSLTFDEFQALMEQVELGISPQELRFVISEADENENGVVDYEEFVPLAVDLIQSFRARNRAKTISSQQDVLVDDQILQTISSSELAMASKVCLEKLLEYDKKNYGLIRPSEFKRCLSSIAPSVGLLESEINLLSQLLPRDQFNRLKYNSTPTSFYEHLSKVRFMTMKNAMIESQGSGLQKYLLELCKEEEKKHDEETMKNSRGGDQKSAPPGYIPCRSLINILTNSPRLSLSRLQVLVIMSEASVLDGYINYYQFIPVVTKAIELMFEPKALRQRAELIARTDLSPEALLHGMGMSQEAFEERLLTLFKSYDIDHNGTLDQNEFIACLESLELQLTKGEMVALMATADVAQHGFLGFEDFVKFFSHNLLHLEREKRIRLLQSSLDQHHTQDQQDAASSDDNSHNGSQSANGSAPQKDLGQQLLSIFELSDPNRTGFITYEDFESILRDFSMHSSPFLMDLLRSELHTASVGTGKMNEDGEHQEQIVLVEYAKSLATCADLFSVYRAKESAWVEHQMKEEEAARRAQQIAQTQIADIHRITRYLLRKMKAVIPVKLSADYAPSSDGSVVTVESHVNESTVFLLSRASYSDLQSVIRSPQAGLSRSETNIVLHRLLGPSFASASGDEGDDATRSVPKHLHHTITDRAVSLSPRPGDVPLSPASKKRLAMNNPSPQATQQISSRDLFDAIFEARKTTIMRTLLQPIDQTLLHQRVLAALEVVWRTDHPSPDDDGELLLPVPEEKGADDDDEDPDAPRDVYGHVIASAARRRRQMKMRSSTSAGGGRYLSVDRCYTALESMNGLPVSRAQLMFVVAAADCYDKTGSLLDIAKLADHIGQVFGQLVGAENIATRGAVVTHGRVDDRKALHGLKDTQLVRHLKNQLLGEVDSDSVAASVDAGEAPTTFTIEELVQVLRDTQRLQLSDRDINTILAVSGLLTRPRDEPLTQPREASERLLASVVDCVVALCRERMIHRRLSLFRQGGNEASSAMHEEGRKTLKALADKMLYVVKLHPSDSVTAEEARRFSGLDTAEYFYPLRVALPGDAKLLRQSAIMDDASSPLFPAHRRHHHHLHRLQTRDGPRTRERASTLQSVASVSDLEQELEATVIDLNLATTMASSVQDYDDDFEDAEVALMVLFKGAVFLPARIPIPNQQQQPQQPSNGAVGKTMTRKASTETMLAVSPAVGSTDSNDNSRPSSSFSRRLQSHVQQGTAASNSSSSAKLPPIVQNYRSVRKGVLLQIVAVDNGGGLSLYSTMGSGLIAQAVSADGSLVVPCASLPLRLPSVGAVDKEAAEQFVANILERLYLEQSPSSLQSPSKAGGSRSSSALSLPKADGSTNSLGEWTLKLLEDEDI